MTAIRHLPRVVPEAPGRPDLAGEDHPMRKVTRQVAFEPGGWTRERASKVAALFDELAPEWRTRDNPHRLVPLFDAVERGGLQRFGWCFEVGSGDGMATPWLAERFSRVMALDLSWEMLVRAPASPGHRVRADASAMPVPDGTADAVVLVNAFLFPAEVDRALHPGGALVWVNTSGDRTPIHLPADAVLEALPGRWSGVASEAAWGTWAVLRRA